MVVPAKLFKSIKEAERKLRFPSCMIIDDSIESDRERVFGCNGNKKDSCPLHHMYHLKKECFNFKKCRLNRQKR